MSWATTREKRQARIEPVRKPRRTLGNANLRAILQKYRKEVSEVRPMGRTKTSHIRYLEKCVIARTPACEIEASDIIAHIRSRRQAGAGP
jgi:hypothetical protein